MHRKLSNGIEYLYYSSCVNNYCYWTIYQLNTKGAGVGMRRSVIMSEYINSIPPITITTDTNGNGIVGDAGDTTSAVYQWIVCNVGRAVGRFQRQLLVPVRQR